MNDTEKIERVRKIIRESGLKGGKVTVDTVISEMRSATLEEVAEIILEMGNLIEDILYIIDIDKEGEE